VPALATPLVSLADVLVAYAVVAALIVAVDVVDVWRQRRWRRRRGLVGPAAGRRVLPGRPRTREATPREKFPSAWAGER
jgi:hypothetical protein